MTRLLILSSDTGEGHNSAAAAIHLAANAAGFESSIRKPLEQSGSLNRCLGNTYNALLTYPRWMGSYFGLINRLRPNERDIFYSRARGFIGRFLDTEKPDVLLSVHPMLNHFIQRFIKEERVSGIPCYTFLTDPFPPFWRGWASPFVDRYFVPTEEALQALTAMGVPVWKIERVPMPVRPQFQPMTMSALNAFRNELHLEDSSTIVLNGGARGGGPLFRIYQRIRTIAPNANVLAICGRNRHLRWQIERLGNPRTHTFGFVEDIHRYVAAADLVITKPGALSTFESLACQAPLLLFGLGGLMPQEAGLFRAALHYEFGFGAFTLDDVARIVKKGPGEWSRLRKSMAEFYRSSSGQELVKGIQFDHVRA